MLNSIWPKVAFYSTETGDVCRCWNSRNCIDIIIFINDLFQILPSGISHSIIDKLWFEKFEFRFLHKPSEFWDEAFSGIRVEEIRLSKTVFDWFAAQLSKKKIIYTVALCFAAPKKTIISSTNSLHWKTKHNLQLSAPASNVSKKCCMRDRWCPRASQPISSKWLFERHRRFWFSRSWIVRAWHTQKINGFGSGDHSYLGMKSPKFSSNQSWTSFAVWRELHSI